MDAEKALEAINELEKWIESATPVIQKDAEDHGVKPSVVESEPVVISHIVTTILSAIVAWGWVALPVPAINLIGTLVALAVVAGIAVAARSKVTPAAKWEDSIKSLVAEAVEAELVRVTAEIQAAR